MIKELLKKFVSEDNKDDSSDVIKELYSVIKEAEKAKGFCLFMSRLYDDGKEERLQHHMFSVHFKDADLAISLEEYEKLAQNHLQQRQLDRLKDKIPGVQPAPVDKKEEPVEAEFEPVEKKDEFKVEDSPADK